MKSVGLALSAGGSRGIAHIGVIKCLVEHDIPIDMISGTSAGALIGGLYASTGDISKVETIFKNLNKREVISLFTDPSIKAGFIKGNKTENFLRRHFEQSEISKFPIKFQAVTTDINTGKTVRFSKGDAVEAIRASISVPLIFKPVVINGRLLVDGGVTEPVPVHTLTKMGADIRIAVNLNNSKSIEKIEKQDYRKPSMLSILRSTILLLINNLAEQLEKEAEIIIKPTVPFEGYLPNLVKYIDKFEEVEQEGYNKTLKQIEKIKSLLR
ncbi:patatin family protein [Candidatus Dojkabacteria bacterium]|nr:patatin family protein [Candidatus Dojkabacteria bacterium]